MVKKTLKMLRGIARNKPLNFNKSVVKSNFSRAEEIQDEHQATKVSRVQKGERRLRRVPVYRYAPETKFKIVEQALTNLGTTAVVVADCLNMTRGTDNENSRIGDKILVTSILSRFVVTQPVGNALGQSMMARVMLVYDRQSNGATIDVSKLLQNPNDSFSALNSDNTGRYRIIWDKIIGLVSQTTSNSKPVTQNNYYKTGLPVNYNANNGTVVDIQKGNIALVAFFDAITTITAAPQIQAMIKISYKDI